MTDNQLYTPLKLGLIGNPISHSKSPALFRAAYSAYPFTYTLIEADTIEKAMERFLKEDFTGINVTAPFKETVFKYITHPDRISSLLKSTNIIIRKGKNKEELHSYNSDYYGVKNTIEEKIQSALPNLPIQNALVIGAGGAGKAAALALKDLGINTFLANRTLNNTIDFVNAVNEATLQSHAHPFDPFTKTPLLEPIPLQQIPQYATKCQLIIYSLSFRIGEMEQVDLSEKIVFEANYAHPQFAPQNLPELQSLPALPYTYISGKYWLYHQAVPAFQLFTGIYPNTTAMKKVICL